MMQSRLAGHRPVLDLRALTGARFVAACGVLTGHFGMTHLLLPWWTWGNACSAVAFFFVLSGFILTYNYADRMPRPDLGAYFKFLQARFARIYPVYLLILLLSTVVTLWAFRLNPTLWSEYSRPRMITGWFASLLMVQAYGWDKTTLGVWCAPAWSLSCEAAFYAMFPLILWRISQLRRPRSIVLCMAGAWLATAMAVATMFFVVTVVLHRSRNTAELIEYFAPYLRIGDFLIGCLAGLLFVRCGANPWPVRAVREIAAWGGLAAMVTVGLLTSGGVIPPSCGCTQIFVPPAALLILGLASGPTSLGSFLSTGTMVRLGEASYSLYLVHWLPWMLIVRLTDKPQMLWSIVSVAFSVAASLALYHFVEEPCRKLLRKPIRVPTLAVELPVPQLALATVTA